MNHSSFLLPSPGTAVVRVARPAVPPPVTAPSSISNAQTHGGRRKKCRKVTQEPRNPSHTKTRHAAADCTWDGIFLSYAKQLKGEHRAPAKILHVTGCHQQGQRHQKCARRHQNLTSEALARTRQDSPLDQRSSGCAEKVVMGRNSEETGSVC